MQAHEIEVIIPQDHRLVVDLPESIGCGPARLIVLVEPDHDRARGASPPKADGQMAALQAELAQDQRPFRELSVEERRERLRRVKGIARDLASSSEELARQKRLEVELEDRKLAG